jgi:hypothetical protein
MAPPASVLSQTLQSITLTKIRELENQRDKYEASKNEVLTAAARYPDNRRKRIAKLLRGVNVLYPEALEDNQVRNVQHWLDQSAYDASVPDHMLQSYEDLLRSKLEVQSRRLGLAHLYARLVTEWMTPPSDEPGSSEEDSFEVLDRQKERLQELCDKFEAVVFEPLETDELEIDLYISEFFKGDKGTKSLKDLRKAIGTSGETMLGAKTPFNEDMLIKCIKGLLIEDLLSDEKQVILTDFLENKVVLGEIADVLNMRFLDIERWDWQAGENGSKYTPCIQSTPMLPCVA